MAITIRRMYYDKEWETDVLEGWSVHFDTLAYGYVAISEVGGRVVLGVGGPYVVRALVGRSVTVETKGGKGK